MRILTTIVIALLIVKVYTGSLLKQAKVENNQLEAFIDNEYKNNLNQNAIDNIVYMLLDLSKTKNTWHQATQQLIDSINKDENAPLGTLIQLFNKADAKELFNYSELSYTNNEGLSYKHNRNLLLQKCYQKIFEKLSDIGYDQPLLERPYLSHIKRDVDSLEVNLTYALAGPLKNISIEYQGDTILTDSLPINLGPIKGSIKLCFNDKVISENRCYKKHY